VNGKVLWNRQISSYNGIDYDDEKIYVSHTLGSLYSLNYETGRTFWRQGDLLNRRLTTPLASKDLVVVGDLEGYLHFLNTENGKFAARIKVDDEAVMSLIEGQSPSQIIATTRGGGLYVVNVDDSTVVSTQPESNDSNEDEPLTESSEEDVQVNEADQQRSILFEKDSIMLPDTDDGGPGITLPRAQ